MAFSLSGVVDVHMSFSPVEFHVTDTDIDIDLASIQSLTYVFVLLCGLHYWLQVTLLYLVEDIKIVVQMTHQVCIVFEYGGIACCISQLVGSESTSGICHWLNLDGCMYLHDIGN